MEDEGWIPSAVPITKDMATRRHYKRPDNFSHAGYWYMMRGWSLYRDRPTGNYYLQRGSVPNAAHDLQISRTTIDSKAELWRNGNRNA